MWTKIYVGSALLGAVMILPTYPLGMSGSYKPTSASLEVRTAPKEKRGPESIPQMTNSSDCSFKDARNWVCRDGYTLMAADSGKLYLYRLGPVDHSAYISRAFLHRID